MALRRLPSSSDFAPPYSLFASIYDRAIGNDFFAHLRDIFERLVERHRIRFRSAADLGCGTGLFARYLNFRWRVPVFAVDASPAMLRIAAANCGSSGVTLSSQNICRLRLPRRVDLITANFDTLNHLLADRDIRALFRSVNTHLSPGGYFIFDFVTPCDAPHGVRVFNAGAAARFAQVIQRIRWLPGRRMFLSDVSFYRPEGRCGVREMHFERAYWPREIAQPLIDAGFILRDVLDAASLKPPRTCPPRMMIVAQKSAEVRTRSCAA